MSASTRHVVRSSARNGAQRDTEEPPGLSRVPRARPHLATPHVRLAEPVFGVADTRAAARVREAVSLYLHPRWRSDACTRLLRLTEANLSLQPGSLDHHASTAPPGSAGSC